MSPLWGILGRNLELEPEVPLGRAFFISQVVKSLKRVYCSEAWWPRLRCPFPVRRAVCTQEQACVGQFLRRPLLIRCRTGWLQIPDLHQQDAEKLVLLYPKQKWFTSKLLKCKLLGSSLVLESFQHVNMFLITYSLCNNTRCVNQSFGSSSKQRIC